MSGDAGLRKLSGLDAGFLTLETNNAPMLIGGASVLDANTSTGRLDVDRFRAVLRQRLGRAVAFRRKLAAVPLDLGRPYWVDLPAEEVDLDVHVERTQLPEPGGWRELSALVAWELSRPLDRDRPLWQIVFVEGVDNLPGVPKGSVALVSKVHHAAIDGVSGAEILGALFDGVEPAPHGEEEPEHERFPEPGAFDLLARAGKDLAGAPKALGRTVGRGLLGLAGSAWSRFARGIAPPLPFTAPKTPLNQPISRARAWAPAFLPLDRIKALKTAADATVNDVVLAICSGALRAQLLAGGELPAEPLVAMVPVSVRAEGERKEAGNLVSAMLVALATDVAEPALRLRQIRDAARSSKVAHQAVGARTLVEAADLLPFALSGQAVRLYSRWQLAGRHRPLFNVVITNVPGPPRALTVAGARLLAHVGAAPLFDGLGLILPVFSYAGTLSIGVTADRALLPDAAGFAARLEAALTELEASVAG